MAKKNPSCSSDDAKWSSIASVCGFLSESTSIIKQLQLVLIEIDVNTTERYFY